MEKQTAFNKKLHALCDPKSPDPPAKPSYCAPVIRTKKGRMLMGGVGDSFMSFYKIENENESKTSRVLTDNNQPFANKETIAKKSQVFENLQETIMK
jgi:hypothetical protein